METHPFYLATQTCLRILQAFGMIHSLINFKQFMSEFLSKIGEYDIKEKK